MAAPQVVQENQNAIAGGVSGSGVGTLAVWLLNRWAKAGLSAEQGAAIAGGVAAAVLFIGRNGIRGVWRLVWRGKG